MKFHELFNQWMKEIGCSARELSETTGLSAAVISRYRSGTRAPLRGSQQLEQLLAGLNDLSQRSGFNEHRRKLLEDQLTASLTAHDGAFERFYPRFDALLSTMGISMKELSRAVNYDISFLYRIRSGKRRPHDLEEFINRICSYAVLNRTQEDDLERLSELTGVPVNQLHSENNRQQVLLDYLSRNGTSAQNSVEGFLRRVETFALEDYSGFYLANQVHLPQIPEPLRDRQLFYGTEEMRTGELVFFQHAANSSSKDPIFMCSDMPMMEMAEDSDFPRQWMLSLANAMQKGLHINIVHDLNRPWKEMVLGLEAWVPLYMTGQISPYYLPKKITELYHHLLYVSGSAALSGECIAGRHDHGRYVFTTNPRDMNYYKIRSKDLLKKARPLMEIYSAERWEEFATFSRESRAIKGDRRNILSRPPVYTMSNTLLWDILTANGISVHTQERILEHYLLERSALRSMTEQYDLEDKISVLSQQEFLTHPPSLSLPPWAGRISYTWEQYQAHLEQTLELKTDHYRALEVPPSFLNIDICILKGSHAVISKHNAPDIHFVVRHPRLVAALENYVVLSQQED